MRLITLSRKDRHLFSKKKAGESYPTPAEINFQSPAGTNNNKPCYCIKTVVFSLFAMALDV
jgi:hypothetical protein